MGDLAGWLLAALVAAVALLVYCLGKPRQSPAKDAQGPPGVPGVQEQQAGIIDEAQSDLDALRDAYNSNDPQAALTAAANAAREQR